MRKLAGTCYFKIDGQQFSVTGGIEMPLNTVVRDDVVAMNGEVFYKETHTAPYIKGTFVVTKNLPIEKFKQNDEMTITAEVVNGMVYVLSNAWLHGESSYNAEDGTVDLEFHGQEGFYQ